MNSARIPKERYTSRDFMQREWDRMWTRVWLLAGHTSEIPREGDFFTLEIGPESLLIVRQPGDRVRAFYNVCQHRGNLLCQASHGNARAFRCGYHHWEYDTSGRLCRAPQAETFQAEAPILGSVRLAEIRCELRSGFVWVSMSPDPEPIDEFLGPIPEHIAPYKPDGWALTGDRTVEIACNWKTSVDVSNEGYHLRSLHPELTKVLDDTGVRVEIFDLHSRMTIPLGRPSRGSPWEGQLTAELRGLMQHMGVDMKRFQGTVDDARPAIQGAVRAWALAAGVDISGLDDEQLVDKHQVYIFPNVQLNFTARTLEIYRHRPHPTDPAVMLFDERSYARVPPSSAPPERPKAARFKHGEAPLGPIMGQDVDLLPMLQRGMASRGFPGLLLSASEACIGHMHRGIDRYLADPTGPTEGTRTEPR